MGGRSRRAWLGRRRHHGDRGATAVEYALGVALICVAALGSVQFLTDASGDELEDRAAHTGAPDLGALPPSEGTTGGDGGGSDGTDTPSEEEPPQPQDVFVQGLTGCRTTTNPWAATVALEVRNAEGDLIDGAAVQLRVTILSGPPNPTTFTSTSEVVERTSSSGVVSYTRDDLKGNGNPQVHRVLFEVLSITGPGPLTYTSPAPPASVLVNSTAQTDFPASNPCS